ncbi:serine protease AprX [Desulfonispora thiosulfatigenes DSM 11270]|uniref:Serine protease AprX n=1 Tax=Desulfonispora thiosulfatigenes DSM 11270 TaxID=656914 RepID=A0A1W1VEL2_DESTI|nr:S8 family peptidase [Desulfonispora thiosulfatigenes]SMB91653.1 serine protease AprX [Desulfonispora thiosulfatigenes DSM 11270]
MRFSNNDWFETYSHKLCPTLKSNFSNIDQPFFRLGFHKNKIPVIVEFESQRNKELAIREIAKTAKCVIDSEIPLINFFTTTVNTKNLELLMKNPLVKNVWHDGKVRALLDIASPSINSSKLWRKNITGKGVGVAVLDTGIYNHPDLEDRIIAFKDFVRRKKYPYDDNGHGTHVAGNVAASGKHSSFRYTAPAPEANIIGVKVLDKDGSGNISTIVRALEWCIRYKERLNIRVINLSLGTAASQTYEKDPLCLAAEKAWKSGIVVCAAAGNSGPDPKTIDSPGIHPSIITVGALDTKQTVKTRDDDVASFSSRGPTIDGLTKPDILAPGVKITSLLSKGVSKGTKVDDYYTTLSGTSMASGVCSGVVAQILQIDSSLTPDQVKTILINSARGVNNLDANLQGSGLIDTQAAIRNLKNNQ